MSGSYATGFTALVLAASRPDDPVARHCGVSHKALVPADGMPMIARVVAALRASDEIGRIAVCIEDAAILSSLPDLLSGVEIVTADRTPSRSVLHAVEALGAPFPMPVTTADHALLSPEIVTLFCRAARESEADLAAGLASATVILRDEPTTRRTFLPFRDDRYSGCNLFALMSPAALSAVRFWTRAEQDRKRPWRLVRHFGLPTLLLFVMRLLSLDQAMRRASRAVGARIAAVRMPYAEAAIDVDKSADLELVETILRRRAPAG